MTVYRWLFEDRKTGRIVIGQKPNASLILFLLLRVAQWITSPHGTVNDILHWAGTAALAGWAIDELVRGVNPFRRGLGLVILTLLIISSV